MVEAIRNAFRYGCADVDVWGDMLAQGAERRRTRRQRTGGSVTQPCACTNTPSRALQPRQRPSVTLQKEDTQPERRAWVVWTMQRYKRRHSNRRRVP
eukprot:364905-Chlamydomonas_euryale.AAC.10